MKEFHFPPTKAAQKPARTFSNNKTHFHTMHINKARPHQHMETGVMKLWHQVNKFTREGKAGGKKKSPEITKLGALAGLPAPGQLLVLHYSGLTSTYCLHLYRVPSFFFFFLDHNWLTFTEDRGQHCSPVRSAWSVTEHQEALPVISCPRKQEEKLLFLLHQQLQIKLIKLTSLCKFMHIIKVTV